MNGPSPESLCVQYAPGRVREAVKPLLSVTDGFAIVASFAGEPYVWKKNKADKRRTDKNTD
jgi:hypothetical protein